MPEQRMLIYMLNLAGGAGKNAVKYANVLAEAGHRVGILCGSVRDRRIVGRLIEDVALVETGATRNLFSPWRLARALRRDPPDVLVVLGVSNMLPVSLALRRAGCSAHIVLREANSPSGLLASYAPLKRLIKRAAFAHAYQRADRVIALTRAMQAELETDWGVPPTKLALINNGVSIPDVPPAAIRAKDPPVLLCVARLVPQKDHETLLRAFALLRAHRPCRLRLAGEGPEKRRLVALAAELGIAADVEFLGHVDDVTPLYQTASLTVLSSRFEGFPNVLIEALAQGCPIVATDCPTGPEEIIGRGNVGFLSAVGDSDDLASKIGSALNKQFKASALIARARMFSDQEFSQKVQKFLEYRPHLVEQNSSNALAAGWDVD